VNGKNAGYVLHQNDPNPFDPHTEIGCSLPAACGVKLSVYSLLSQRIRILVNEHQSTVHRVGALDATDEGGDDVASRVYFYRIRPEELTDSRKMILMK
jgi:hypothetical protein